MRKGIASLVVLATLVGALGCGYFVQSRQGSDLESLRKQIDEEIGDARADRVSQCRTIAFGSKPCGGPWQYLAYSTRETNTLKLSTLVARYNELEAEINLSEGRASDCAYVTRPDTALVGARCVLEP